jgi:serine/threonine protein kinase
MSEEYTNALPVGTEIDAYRIEGILGVGGFGITYLVRDLNLGKYYAIKELLPDGIAVRQVGTLTVMPRSNGDRNDFAATRKYFISEAQVLAGMNHPAVVKVHRLMEANGTCYMVMDYVEGDTLTAYLKKEGGALNGADQFLQIFYPLMEGLEVLHNQGIIHRDIKPGNIMIQPNGLPVLLDFGAATQTQSKTVTITQMLSAGYSPFEQYTSRAKQGPYTDVYALGATMLKCISGNKPDDASDRVYNDTYQSLLWNESYISIYGSPILSAVDAALKMEPKQRPQNIAQWRALMSSGGVAPSPLDDQSGISVLPHSPEAWQVLPTEQAGGFGEKIKKVVTNKWVLTAIASVAIGYGLVMRSSWTHGKQSNKESDVAEVMPPAWEDEAIDDTLDIEILEEEVIAQDTLNSLSNEFIIQLNRFTDVMMSVNDRASAEEAAEKLGAIGDEMEAIAARLAVIEPPNAWEKSRIEEKMASMTIDQQISSSLEIISADSGLARIVQPAVADLDDRMKNLNLVFERYGMKREVHTRREQTTQRDTRMNALVMARSLHKRGKSLPPNFFDLVDKDALKSLAEEGVAEAQFMWGLAHHSKIGILGNDREMVKWMRESAWKGYAAAQTRLGLSYASGMGTSKNEAEAVRCYRKAAEQGDARGQYYLGRCYLLGVGIDHDKEAAKIWLTKAVKNTDTVAAKAARDLWREVHMANDFQVVKATYGAAHTHRNVTDIVRRKVKNGRLNFRADSGELGGDPIFGKVKTFTILYVRGGERFTRKYSEGRQVKLP